MKIQQSDIAVIVAERLEGLFAVGGDVDVMPALGQQQLQNLVGGRAVFRDQDPAPGRRM
jgi:hypothetical protein